MRKIVKLAVAALLLCSGLIGQVVPPPPDSSDNVTLHAEKKLVLVDAVVTDKKGNYVHDLTAKDFKVWDDKKEASIESFSFQADPASPANGRKHYLILFFDNSTMKIEEQAQARQAANKFMDANSDSEMLAAVINFGGRLQITQNFTANAGLLKQAISGVKFSSVTPNGDASLGPQFSKAMADFGARDMLMALRTLAKSLAAVPGRKTLVLLSSGFPLDSEMRSELTATIDACNKANVAVYPIDARGLIALGWSKPQLEPEARLVPAMFVQRGGPQSGGGRGNAGTPALRNDPGIVPNAANNPNQFGMTPFNQPRQIVPDLPKVSTNQEVLYALASGTGGFLIMNTNNLVGGLEKIQKEQNEYYVLGYSPEDSKEGSCHEIKVKVERSSATVRSRSGYCNTKPVDLLAGSSVEKSLETRAASATAGNIQASMALPFFYTSPNTARVDAALEIPATALKFEKSKGKLESEMNILGIAYDVEGGAVAARFSDTVKLSFDTKKEVDDFQAKPMHYDTQFEIGSGKYNVKVVFSTGEQSFGKVEVPLAVDPYDTKNFSLSGVAISQTIRRLTALDTGLDSELLDDKKPLVSQGMQITPSGTNVLNKAHPAVVYLEVYEPLMAEGNGLKVGLAMRVIDVKSGEQKLDTGFLDVVPLGKEGNPVIPVGWRIPLDNLTAGSYRAEFKAVDSAGNLTIARSTDFVVQ